MSKNFYHKTNNAYFASVGWLLLAANLSLTCFYYDIYLEANQHVFHLPLVVAIWLLVFPQINIFIFGCLAIVGFLAYYFHIIEYTHQLLASYQLLPQYFIDKAMVNPQYPKLFLYGFVLLIFSFFILKKKHRTPHRFFSFTSCLSCLLITYLIHLTVPMGSLTWEREMALKHMTTIVRAIENSKNQPSFIDSICSTNDLTCYKNFKYNQFATNIQNKTDNVNISTGVNNMFNSEQKYIVYEGNANLEDHNTIRYVIGIFQHSSNRFTAIMEKKLLNESQLKSEELFGRLAMYANLMWGQAFMLIALLHTSPIRKKIWY